MKSFQNSTSEQRREILSRLSRNEKALLLHRLSEANAFSKAAGSDRYAAFRRRYRDDPAAFVVDCIDWDRVPNSTGPALYQIAILDELAANRRVTARGPHGLGKSTVEAWTILWFALTSEGEDWKALTTASAWRQLTVYLWPEVHKWSRLLKWGKVGRAPFTEKRELLDLAIKLGTGAASAVASNDHEKIEGAHADRLLFAYDEAKIIPDETYDASEGAFSTGECYGLAVSTPGPPIGRFYDIHMRKPGYEDWSVIHVTLDDAVKAGRISPEWAEQRRLQWGEDSAIYRNRVLGEFAESSSDGVIPLTWVESAIERWHEWNEDGRPGRLTMVGADIGESDDPTVLAPRFETDEGQYVIDRLEEHKGLNTMESTAEIVSMMNRADDPRVTAVVDGIGIGSGVVARLREKGRLVVSFIASEKSERRDESDEFGFANKRAEAWWNLREILDPSRGSTVAIAPDSDDLLVGELVAPRYRDAAGGRLVIESKDDLRKRLKRSTDRADAVVMVLNERPVTFDPKISVGRRRSERRDRVW